MDRRLTALLAAFLTIGVLSGAALAVELMSEAVTDPTATDGADTNTAAADQSTDGVVSPPDTDSTPVPGDAGPTVAATPDPFPEAADPIAPEGVARYAHPRSPLSFDYPANWTFDASAGDRSSFASLQNIPADTRPSQPGWFKLEVSTQLVPGFAQQENDALVARDSQRDLTLATEPVTLPHGIAATRLVSFADYDGGWPNPGLGDEVVTYRFVAGEHIVAMSFYGSAGPFFDEVMSMVLETLEVSAD